MSPVDKLINSCPAWKDFFSTVTGLPDSARGQVPDKGKAFERLTQLYLRTAPEYQTKLAHVWLARNDLPKAVRQKLRLPEGDEGIDIIAETVEGEFWSVQCKFRTDTHRALTVGELATFANLSFNVCRNISLAVVAHTCAKPVKKKKLLGRTTEIGLDRWLALDDEAWDRIKEATSRRKPPPPAPKTPRADQNAAVKAAITHFVTAKASRGRLIMPCGTGKSLTAYWIAKALRPKSIVVAVPSLSLIKQSLNVWTREFLAHGEVPEWLCVCSDETTGALDRDDFVSEVYELGVDATTDPDEIARFLRMPSGKRKIIFTTYHSGVVLARAARKAHYVFDLGIMDEAHRTVGAADKSFGHLLSGKNIQIKKRLFMTATERIVRGGDEDVLSMDDPTVYGERFYQMSFKQAIEAKPPIISDYRILTIAVADERVRELIAKNRYLRISRKVLGEREAQALAAGIGLQRAFRERNVCHAISFHRSIRAADDFREQHEEIVVSEPKSRRPDCFHISSHKTTGERAEILENFRESKRAVITNARCLQEGVDVPSVDCILFADPKQSVVDIVQAAGRAMRLYAGKTFGYVVIPIVVPRGMDFEAFAETTEFKQITRVVTALSTQDDRIVEEFRAIGGRKRGTGRIVEISGDVPVGYRIELAELRQKIWLKLWQRIGRANSRQFEKAKEFVQALGLRSNAEWRDFCSSGKLPADIPATPERAYAHNGWQGWGDWLGTGAVSLRGREYMPFMQARAFVRRLKLESTDQWRAYCRSGKLPADIPWTPRQIYENDGWKGMGDWLGTGAVAKFLRKFRPFSQARAFARKQNLRSGGEWRTYCKSGMLPSDIPAAPEGTYRDKGWKGMGDWLGTGTIAPGRRTYRSFLKARAFVRKLGLRTVDEWRTYCRRGEVPNDIPANPHRYYQESGWISFYDWLGKK